MYKRLIISGLMKTVSNYPIPNTFRMKVKCALYVEIESEEELAAMDFGALPQPVMVMGGGSNLLFTKDFPGTVLHISSPSPYPCPGVDTSAGGCFVTLPAGTVFDDFCASLTISARGRPLKASGVRRTCPSSRERLEPAPFRTSAPMALRPRTSLPISVPGTARSVSLYTLTPPPAPTVTALPSSRRNGRADTSSQPSHTA